MDLSYQAAEYFIDAIGQSSSLHISYDYVTHLGYCASEEIKTYFVKNAVRDHFFIFKKFPDVFTIQNGYVRFTDPFLFIYALKRATSSKVIKSPAIANYYENSAVSFCNIIISRYGPQHYLRLFQSLVNDSNRIVGSHFCHYSMSDAYNFFLAHADTFTMNNCFVSINIKRPEKNFDDSPTTSKELIDSVYFLLTCFDSLHYIELKQIISYVLKSVKDLLDKYSLIKQRKMFHNLPKIKMNHLGFLSLEDLKVSMSISNDIKILLLLVCILVFEREIHCEKIVKDIASGRSSVVGSLCNLPLDEQLQFFKNYPNYFCVSDKGYISLLPSFICPICSFQDSPVSKHLEINQSSMKSEILNSQSQLDSKLEKDSDILDKQPETQSELSSTLKKDSNAVDKHPETSGKDILSRKSNGSQENSNSLVKDICTEMFKLKEVAEHIKRRLVVSVLFLFEIFGELDHKRVLKTLFHVFCDVRVSFCSLSETDKHDFVKAYCELLNSKSVKKVEFNSAFMWEISKEKILLFITYMLTDSLEVHFEKIAEEIRKKKIVPLSSSVSEQFKFFKTFPVLIKLRHDGYVSLAHSFDPVSSVVESYSDLILKYHPKDKIAQNKGRECVSKVKKAAASNEVAHLLSGTKKSVSPKKNKIDSKASEKIKTIDERISFYLGIKIEDKFKTLNYSSSLIRMHFKNALDNHIIESYLLAFSDVYKYFCDLSVEHQYKFVEECYNLIKSSKDTTISEDSHCITTNQGVLTTTYLIVRYKRMHFQKIVTSLNNLNVSHPVCKKTVSEQFRYFKNFGRYIEIKGDGFVTLKASFNYVSSVINYVIAFKSKKSSACVQINKQEQTPFRPPQKGVRQVSFSPQDSLMVKVESKNSPQKGTVENYQMIQVSPQNTETKSSCRREIGTNTITSQDEHNAKDAALDLCVFILSCCKDCCLSIEDLCSRVSSYDFRYIPNYISSLTASEKQEFFKSHSDYFDISTDGFVSLKQNVDDTYVAKTKLNLSYIGPSEKSIDCVDQSKSESIKTNLGHTFSDEATASQVKDKNFQRTTIASKCTPVIHNSCAMSPKKGLEETKSLRDNIVSPGTSRVFSLSKLLDSKSNIQQKPRFQDKLSCLPKPIDFKMSPAKEIPISSRKYSEHQVPEDSHKDMKTTEQVIMHSASYDAMNKQAVRNCSVLTKSDKISSTDNFNDSILSSKEKEVSSQTLSNLSIANSASCYDSLYDNADDAYISELIDSFLRDSKNQSFKNNSDLEKTSAYQDIQITNTAQCSHNRSKIHNDVNTLRHDFKNPNDQNSAEKFSFVTMPQFNSVPRNSDDSTSVNSQTPTEMRAVNFFCVILENYKSYESGVCVKFLQEHLLLASSEVQHFMDSHYKDDMLSFFLKHKEVFYVSPESRNICLVNDYGKL